MATEEQQQALQVAEQFDHMSAAFGEDPWATMGQLREHCPVARSDANGGFWVVSGFAEVCEVARDDTTWASDQGILIGGLGPIRHIPIEVDPPDFFKYRRLLNPLFAPDAINRREDEIRRLATSLIDDFIEAGKCDIHRALAMPLPAIMTYRLLGLPDQQAVEFVQTFEASTSIAEPGDDSAGLLAHFGLVMETITARRAEPRDDIISYLVHSEIEGRTLTDEELLGFIALILAGGLLTTTDAIGNALVRLQEQRDDRRRLVADRSLIPNA
ncbi:MAG: hypothetical protein ABW364_16120, partial [Rhodococcus fascians]